jgi:hypothetical protein
MVPDADQGTTWAHFTYDNYETWLLLMANHVSAQQLDSISNPTIAFNYLLAHQAGGL